MLKEGRERRGPDVGQAARINTPDRQGAAILDLPIAVRQIRCF